ncbi:Holliday junction ATP-dependent DNA helicase RuvA [Rosistilla carotiformis]|uniref:Holliday junction branch migration complex subunit RuvA n=1 Tax=Rosistilla carotiformis TaxID=2528017 RepID=A0A518JP54_9BACT|nr:Holliday junction branch migration protein RuvA [Rosistilla carotiformis]QDV67332.1 Holliday junction ATP-dependent DNA helicase RuvA [Rosistilla carotiformis]
MITKITGKLASLSEESAILDIPPFEYEVFIPDFTRRQLQGKIGTTISLHTLNYIDGNAAQGGRLSPRLVGFVATVEKQFFELFCSVDGVGVKKALRAMVRPVKEMAVMIEQQDAKGLSSLPGIGPATAERVIAKLRRKMPRFALLVGRDATPEGDDDQLDVVRDTFDALLALGHGEADARQLIDDAMASKKKFKDTESLLTAIYQKSTQ